MLTRANKLLNEIILNETSHLCTTCTMTSILHICFVLCRRSYIKRAIRHFPKVQEMLQYASDCAVCGQSFLNTWLECVHFVDAHKVRKISFLVSWLLCPRPGRSRRSGIGTKNLYARSKNTDVQACFLLSISSADAGDSKCEDKPATVLRAMHTGGFCCDICDDFGMTFKWDCCA